MAQASLAGSNSLASRSMHLPGSCSHSEARSADEVSDVGVSPRTEITSGPKLRSSSYET
jgi:hypothetical protein